MINSNQKTVLHIFRFHPVSVRFKNFREFWIRGSEQYHQNIQTPEQTERWFTCADDLRQCAVSGEFRFITDVVIPVFTKFTVRPNRDDDLLFHYIVYPENI